MPPAKLTSAVADTLLQTIRAGSYLETAAAYVGIHRATLHRWTQRGEKSIEFYDANPDVDEPGDDDDAPYRSFVRELAKARAIAETRAVAVVQQAMADSDDKHQAVKAAQWFLERSFPQRWSQHSRTEVTGADGGPITLAGDDALNVALQAALARQAEEEAAEADAPS